MGNLTNQPEQELSQSLKGEYQIQSHPYLLHRTTNELCTLHKITTNSAPHSHRVAEVIQEYSHSKCESISKLKAHYLIDKRGYCSDEETYFLIFKGQNNYTLKDEVIKRRFYQKPFKEVEIQHIIETYLCGLREYSHRFQRDYDRLALDSLVIDQITKRIYLKDPWLSTLPDHEHSDKLIQLMQSYPSPQKLSALHAPKVESYNQFLSNLFSVGVICLQLKRLDFADTIYSKKKQLNYQDIHMRLGQIRDQKLKRGISLLLDMQPNRRKQVYMIWGIENKQEHYLTPLTQQQNINQYHKNREEIANAQKRVNSQVNLNPQPKEVLPKQVESIYIPAHNHNLHTRSNTPTNIHFSHQEQAKASVNLHIGRGQTIIPNHVTTVRQSQQAYQPQQQRKMETAKSFVSFKEYLSKEEVKPQLNTNLPQISIVNTKQLQPQQHRSYSPESRANHQPYTANVSQNPIKNLPQTIAPSKTINTTQPVPVFGAYKESFIYYEQPNSKQPQRSIPLSQQQQNRQIDKKFSQTIKKNEELKAETNFQSLNGRETKVKQTNIGKNIIRNVQSKEISPIKQQKDIIEELKAEIKTETSPGKPNPNISETETFLVKQEDNYDRTNTPKRPTSKNKFNSTIVEVRDEDTPDHSAKSQELIQQEYVVEEYETGSRYEGFKSGGMRNGRGRFYYQDGGYYEGQWKNNKMDGYGKLYYEGGKLAYEGQWSQDQFNGLGKVYNDNPVGFTGSFDYTNFDYLEDYWQYYEGMLSRDTKQGRGRIKLSNGEMFEGDFHEDKIQGFGKFHIIDGKTIEGIWRESKLIKIISN